MVKAAGYWAWWNQYGSVPLPQCAQRAKDAGVGVIVKSGWANTRGAFVAAGVPWATEAYVYPDSSLEQMERLAADCAQGAEFAVINAEVEWEGMPASVMERAIARFQRIQPRAELYASVDTRGARTQRPYQQVLAQHVAGWMPMIYPKEFFHPPPPQGFVELAFASSLNGKTFTAPVLPTIQIYHQIGADAVRAELAEVERRGLPGCQAYTICHATDEEWAVFAEAAKEDDDVTEQELRDMQAGFKFLAEIIVGNTAAINFLSEIAVNHERRFLKLGSKPEDGEND